MRKKKEKPNKERCKKGAKHRRKRNIKLKEAKKQGTDRCTIQRRELINKRLMGHTGTKF